MATDPLGLITNRFSGGKLNLNEQQKSRFKPFRCEISATVHMLDIVTQIACDSWCLL